MDKNATPTMRAWLMGAAAAGMVSPALLIAQTARPSAQPPRPLPAPGAIRPVQYQPGQPEVQVAESEIEQRLRELYERDGREMPPMQHSKPSAPQPLPQTNAQPIPLPANRAATPAMQPRQTGAPQVKQTATTPQPGRVSSFFKKLMPGGNRSAQTATPPTPPQPFRAPTPAPAQLAPETQTAVRPAKPAYAPAPYYAQPQPTPNLRSAQAAPLAPVAPQAQLQPLATPPAVFVPPSPATAPAPDAAVALPPSPSAPADEFFEAPPTPTVENEAEFFELPTMPVETPQPPAADDDDEFDLDADDAPQMDAAPELPTAPTEAVDDFDPFGENAPPAAASSPDDASAAESPAEEITNPYTGKTLNDDEAPALPAAPLETDAPEAPVLPAEPAAEQPAAIPAPVAQPADDAIELPDESTSAKMRRIIQRTDMKGLKGFCPVTLRDQRELADSRPEFSGTYRGQKFFFASKVAQSKFEQDPARYAPAAYGADVVVLTDDQDVAEGTLDHAAWFKGRLYLFGTQENHDKFVNQPEKYATPPGIE